MIKKKFFLSILMLFSLGQVMAQEVIVFTDIEKKWIKEHPVVYFGYDSNWPPFEFYTEGKYTGMIAEYIEIIEKETGIDMIPVADLTYTETLDKLENGELHVAPMIGITDYRQTFLDFTSPYLTDPQVVVTRNNFKFINGISDLKGDVITQPIGYKRINVLKKEFPSIKIITTNDVKECLSAVSSGQADAFVGSLSVVSYYINDFGLSNLKIASSTHLGDIKFRLAVTKDWYVFRDIVEKIFSNISQQQRNEIRNNWISIRYEHGIDKRQVRNYIIFGVFAFLLLGLFFFIWNKTLRKQIKIRNRIEGELRVSLSLINDKNKEKDTLLKEIHHRVKNNLQMIHSMLNMQSRQVDNEYTRQVLSQGKSRIKAISLVHQLLYQSDDFNEINIQDYVNSLKENVSSIYKSEVKSIEICVMANDVSLNIDKAIPLGLILNELLTNSYKYAFEGKNSGSIYINIEKNESNYSFAYKDDGVGFDVNSLIVSDSLGMNLITRLSHQLGATPIFKNNNGLELSFDFEI
ncbi:MAG: transporter substrate-binding domain-containing protein [Flavobacteriaceae bacterium]|nr:transporter substrate-binding domain-containing protein [Flavobacteriaceae bacterium]